MAFKVEEHLLDIKGKKYLPVAWRQVWFREVHPKGSIQTEPFVLADVMIFRATVASDDGAILAVGHATVRAAKQGDTWAGREIEKAETAAIGRALGAAGFGSQFEAEDDEDFLADSPVEKSAQPAAKVVSKSNGSKNAPPWWSEITSDKKLRSVFKTEEDFATLLKSLMEQKIIGADTPADLVREALKERQSA